jgi:hypothetical protein
MKKAADTFAEDNKFTAILCMLETETSHWFDQLFTIAKSSEKVGSWKVVEIADENMLRLIDGDEKELILVPGQQIITAERLELLIIGATQNKVDHRKPIETYVQDYSDSHLVIIPWGVGKWLGSRGQIVNRLIANASSANFALGDNSGRPGIWKKVKQFNLARQNGLNILPGSDPLPVKGQHKKVASYGSIIRVNLNFKGIIGQLRVQLLSQDQGMPGLYGSRDNIFNFITTQLLLRLSPVKNIKNC